MDDRATELMTLRQAADTLTVSMGLLRKLLVEGVLMAVTFDGGERLRSADVLAYEAGRDARRRAGLQELTHLTEELGGYEKELKRSAEDGK